MFRTYTLLFLVAVAVALAVGFTVGQVVALDEVESETAPATPKYPQRESTTEKRDANVPADGSLLDSQYAAQVLRVFSGEEVEILYQPTEPLEFDVRLLQVDMPRYGPEAETAREAVARMVYGKRIYLVWENPSEPMARLRDGRFLAYLFTEDGVNVNLELVRQGVSPYVTRFGEGRFPEQFRQAEQQAKEAKRGIWAE